MIQVEEVTKYYGDLKALDEVSFEVKQGEIVGFLGPNAAGKTTTMRIITGYLAATSGNVKVAGYDVVEDSLEARRCIGYLPETVPLYNEMTVRGYLGYMARLRGVPRNKRGDRVDYVLNRCGLEDYADAIIGHLSKGYRQRVGVAQAMVHDPMVLILDEPTIGLDPLQVVEVRRLIKDLGKEHTIILSTHILPEVEMTCERVLIIHRGRLVAEGTPGGLSQQVQRAEQFTVRLKSPPADPIQALREVEGVTQVRRYNDEAGTFIIESKPGQDIREKLAFHIAQKGWGLLELRRSEMTLEEIFVNIITQEEGVQK